MRVTLNRELVEQYFCFRFMNSVLVCNVVSSRACCPLASDVEICNFVNWNWNLLFSWAYSAHTVRPPPKLAHERRILGMSTKRFPLPKIVPFWAVALSQKYPIFSCIGTCKIPCTEIRPFTPVYVCGHRFTSFVSKWVQDKWPKSPRSIGDKRFRIIRCNPGGDLPWFFCAHRDPHFMLRVSSKSV